MVIQDQAVKVAVDITSGGVAGAALLGWLPPIAALFTIVWTGLQIYDWYKKKKAKKAK